MDNKQLLRIAGNNATDATGSHELPQNFRIVHCPIGRFEVTIKLTEKNEFVNVEEIKVNKDFIEFKQKSVLGFHDVDEYYRE